MALVTGANVLWTSNSSFSLWNQEGSQSVEHWQLFTVLKQNESRENMDPFSAYRFLRILHVDNLVGFTKPLGHPTLRSWAYRAPHKTSKRSSSQIPMIKYVFILSCQGFKVRSFGSLGSSKDKFPGIRVSILTLVEGDLYASSKMALKMT